MFKIHRRVRMKKHFNIHVYQSDEEFSVFFKVDESKVSEDYEDDEIINLAVGSGKLDEEDAILVDSIEEISEEEYTEGVQGLRD
jgi:hypothetical protein